MKVRKNLIDRKSSLFRENQDIKKKANNLANFLYIFASNIPSNFGVYKHIARDEINEMLSHYEEDLKEAIY